MTRTKVISLGRRAVVADVAEIAEVGLMIRANRTQGAYLMLMLGLIVVVMAGPARAFVDAATEPETTIAAAVGEALDKNMTLTNLALIGGFLLHLGMYRQQFRYISSRVEEHEIWIKGHDDRIAKKLEPLHTRIEAATQIRAVEGKLDQIMAAVGTVGARVEAISARVDNMIDHRGGGLL